MNYVTDFGSFLISIGVWSVGGFLDLTSKTLVMILLEIDSCEQ
jgi:hypothetical protein